MNTTCVFHQYKKINTMRFEDLKIGQHLWVLVDNELLMVAKFDEQGYQVCGEWEFGISPDKCKIIELVDVPKGYEITGWYYSY